MNDMKIHPDALLKKIGALTVHNEMLLEALQAANVENEKLKAELENLEGVVNK